VADGAGVVTLERIVVGLDGSEGSAIALGWAIDLAKAVDAEIVAVHVYDVPLPVIAPTAGVPLGIGVDQLELERMLRESAEEALSTEWSAQLDGAGVRYRRLLVEGTPGDVLLEVAERERASLLVTGRRGRGAIVSLLAGSVSAHLVHRSRIPVAIIPSAGDREEREGRRGA
jgi:nucleotide-binding universal stress UspA family protein